ncbi:hypothetical protein BDR06DRAFT_789334 [Suillus hirtellus]|nr:hypothetical protein BDR06DRAFT_789334 [Suillus hirtellus]
MASETRRQYHEQFLMLFDLLWSSRVSDVLRPTSNMIPWIDSSLMQKYLLRPTKAGTVIIEHPDLVSLICAPDGGISSTNAVFIHPPISPLTHPHSLPIWP